MDLKRRRIAMRILLKLSQRRFSPIVMLLQQALLRTHRTARAVGCLSRRWDRDYELRREIASPVNSGKRDRTLDRTIGSVVS